jgi:hypothetical protein
MYTSRRDFSDPSLDHLSDLMREVAKSIESPELIVFLPIVDQHKIMLSYDYDPYAQDPDLCSSRVGHL